MCKGRKVLAKLFARLGTDLQLHGRRGLCVRQWCSGDMPWQDLLANLVPDSLSCASRAPQARSVVASGRGTPGEGAAQGLGHRDRVRRRQRQRAEVVAGLIEQQRVRRRDRCRS